MKKKSIKLYIYIYIYIHTHILDIDVRICFSKILFSLVNFLNGNFLTKLDKRHELNKFET